MDNEEKDDCIFTTEVSVVSIAWNFLHTLVLFFIMIRINIFRGAAAVASLFSISLVDAVENHYCRLENNVYYCIMLYLNCVCQLLFQQKFTRFTILLLDSFGKPQTLLQISGLQKITFKKLHANIAKIMQLITKRLGEIRLRALST